MGFRPFKQSNDDLENNDYYFDDVDSLLKIVEDKIVFSMKREVDGQATRLLFVINYLAVLDPTKPFDAVIELPNYTATEQVCLYHAIDQGPLIFAPFLNQIKIWNLLGQCIKTIETVPSMRRFLLRRESSTEIKIYRWHLDPALSIFPRSCFLSYTRREYRLLQD